MINKIWILLALVLVVVSCKTEYRFQKVAVDSARRYVASEDGIVEFTVLPPEGSWLVMEEYLTDRAKVYFTGQMYTGVYVQVKLSMGASNIVFDENGNASAPFTLSPFIIEDHKIAERTLLSGDYRLGLEEYYRLFYTKKLAGEWGTSKVIPSLIKIHGYTCWQYREQKGYGPLPDSPLAPRRETTSFTIDCPAWVDGKVGIIKANHSISISTAEYRAAYGDKALTRVELIADFKNRLLRTFDSLEIHINLTQPTPNNSEPTINSLGNEIRK